MNNPEPISNPVSYKGDVVMWSIPNFMWKLENGPREIQTSKSQQCTNSLFNEDIGMFRFKLKILGAEKSSIDIFYSSPEYLDSVETLLNIGKVSTPGVMHQRSSNNQSNQFYVTAPTQPSICSIVTKKHTYVFPNKWQHLITLFRNETGTLLDRSSRSIPLFGDGSLFLQMQFTLGKKKSFLQAPWPPENTILSNYKNLFDTGKFSDAVMKSVEGEEFKVHKGVLAVRSEVLCAHFEHGTVESNTNVVDTQLESAVLQQLLEFIYTGSCPKLNEVTDKLLEAADYYQLDRLKSLCEDFLHKQLTIDNAIKTLQIAELYSAKKLKQLTLEFIKDDDIRLKKITKTDGWAKCESATLLKEICNFIAEGDGD